MGPAGAHREHHRTDPVPGNPEQLAIDAIVARHGGDGARLLPMLHDVQDLFGWLPPHVLQRVAMRIGWPLARVQATASFYALLYTRPVGAYRVLFSDNITDRMLGSAALMQALCRALWVEPGRVANDARVSVDTTSCTGMGDQGPAALVNGHALTRRTPQRIADRDVDPPERGAGRLAARLVRSRRQHPPSRRLAGTPKRTRRGAARRPCSPKSTAPACAAAAVPVSRPRPSGAHAATRRVASDGWCATPTRANRERSRTACCSAPSSIVSSTAWPWQR
jgi:NADH:ubiquinone oxidoreductase subunit E